MNARIWALVGAIAAAGMLAVGWFVFIGPQRGETAALNDRVAAAEANVASLQHRLIELREQRKNLPAYAAELARARAALPATAGAPDLLRELHAAGVATNTSVTGVAVGAPIVVKGTISKVYALPVSLTVDGDAASLDRFLDQLQRVRPRALLLVTANAAAVDDGVLAHDEVSLSLTLAAFVAPDIGGK